VSSSTIRKIVIFGVIALILGGATIGGVRFMKARNSSYVSGPRQQTAANTSPQKTPQPQPSKNQAKKDETKTTPNTTPQPATSDKQAPAASPAPVAPATTTTPAPDPAKNSVANNALPATTAVSPLDFAATFGLMAAAAFFGGKLLKVRAVYRRYLGL
jgi:outer membrane biosynthesis protein TonB